MLHFILTTVKMGYITGAAPIKVWNLIGGKYFMVHMIDHVPLYPLQYPEKGQNYVFNGCMNFFMECIKTNSLIIGFSLLLREIALCRCLTQT